MTESLDAGQKIPAVARPGSLWDRRVDRLIETLLSAVNEENPRIFIEGALRNVVEIAGAERGIFFREIEGDWQPEAIVQTTAESPASSAFSRSVLEKVKQSQGSVHVLDSDEGTVSPSMARLQLRSAMAAPVRAGEDLLGAIYVDSHASRRKFEESDLKLFEAVVNAVALAWGGARTRLERWVVERTERSRLEAENTRLRRAFSQRSQIVARSQSMQGVYQALNRVAPTDAAVLIEGETGTGKEGLAHLVHELSPRSNGPFVVVDCASIPETLLEAELFGYEKGAFTGAVSAHMGRIESASGGTLFMDEVGELAPTLQAKLLRALQEKEIQRVGSTKTVKSDFRVVSATNRDLKAMVAKGAFREDLIYRLAVVSLKVPPLRERQEDLEELSSFFARQASEAWGLPQREMDTSAIGAIRRHAWPGNIRELKHRIEQAVILARGEKVTAADLGIQGETQPEASGGTLATAIEGFERRFVLQGLQANHYNISQTARVFGISRQHLHNLMNKHGITRPGAEA